MRLNRADTRKGFGIKVQNHRSLFQSFGEREFELLARKCGVDGEVGGGVARFQRRPCSGGEEAETKRKKQNRRLHEAYPFNRVLAWPLLNDTPDQINADRSEHFVRIFCPGLETRVQGGP